MIVTRYVMLDTQCADELLSINQILMITLEECKGEPETVLGRCSSKSAYLLFRRELTLLRLISRSLSLECSQVICLILKLVSVD